MLTDPIADMLSRIRNANRAMHDTVAMPTSRMKEEIARLLQDEGYIKGFTVDSVDERPILRIEFKYGPDGEQVLQSIARVSKPGCRVYRNWKEHAPVLRGMGITVLTTTKGVLSDREARARKLGGEVLFEVY